MSNFFNTYILFELHSQYKCVIMTSILVQCSLHWPLEACWASQGQCCLVGDSCGRILHENSMNQHAKNEKQFHEQCMVEFMYLTR